MELKHKNGANFISIREIISATEGDLIISDDVCEIDLS